MYIGLEYSISGLVKFILRTQSFGKLGAVFNVSRKCGDWRDERTREQRLNLRTFLGFEAASCPPDFTHKSHATLSIHSCLQNSNRVISCFPYIALLIVYVVVALKLKNVTKEARAYAPPPLFPKVQLWPEIVTDSEMSLGPNAAV